MKRIACFLLCTILTIALLGCKNSAASASIDFSKEDFSSVHSAVLRNLHNGKGSYISKSEDISRLCTFLRTTRGKNGQSSEGFYGGSYTLILYTNSSPTQAVLKDEAPLYKITFTFSDDAEFLFGDDGNGYPLLFQAAGISSKEIMDILDSFDLS